MRMRLGLVLLLASFAALSISFCSGCGRARALNVIGSTSVQPFAEKLAEDYRVKYPDRQRVNVQGGGSTQGVVNAENGVADIGTCSRALSPEEAKQLTPVVIARDGLAIIVNKSNPIDKLATDQVRSIFAGRITNWKEVGGSDKTITVVSREAGSGTRECFMELVMKGDKIPSTALFQNTNGSVKTLVSGNPDAIGYMSLGQVGTEVKALAIDGVPATDPNILNSSYKLSRPFLFVTKGAPTPAAKQFIDYVLSPEGQAMLAKEGLIKPE